MATRRERSHKKREKGENDIKEEQVEKGLRTIPYKSAQKWKEPSKWSKDKTTKAKICIKDSLRKKALQNKTKNKQIARHRHRNTEREPELTHLFKNNSFDISLYREYLYTCRVGFIFICGISVAHPVLVLFLCREFLLHIPSWLHSFLTRECFLHIPSCLHFYVGICLDFYVGNFSHTSRAGFDLISRLSFTDPMLVSVLSG